MSSSCLSTSLFIFCSRFFCFSPPRSLLGKKIDNGSAASRGPEKVDDGVHAGTGSVEMAPPVDQAVTPAGGVAGEGQGAMDVPPQL